MLDELTPQQFDEWRAFHLLEPFGPIAAARLAAAQLLAWCSSDNAPSLDDVLASLGYDRWSPPMTTEDAAQADSAILAGFGF